MTQKYKLTFLNHSSFAIEINNIITLVDPWFKGKIFNNSWALMKETDDSIIDYSKVKYISLSHEHPDHLNWDTLKYIRSKTKNNITILYPRRNNSNVMDYCKKLGYSFTYIDHYVETEIEKGYTITPFPAGHDNALVYRLEDKVVCNQNDAYLEGDSLQLLKSMFPTIDLWLFQFSLAGYYGNMDDPATIEEKGKKFHIDKFVEYQKYLKPKMSVPFASFVYFCKEYNSYINKFAVKLSDILKHSFGSVQIPFYNEELFFDSNERNKEFVEKWDKIIQTCEKDIDPVKKFVGESKILELLQKIRKEGYNPKSLALQFFDYEKCLLLTPEEDRFVPIEEVPESLIAGKVPTEELHAYLTTPWGADTLNITGAFIKKNLNLWTSFMMSRDIMYRR